MPDPELPSVDALQFRRAQPIVNTETPAARSCAACKQLIPAEYYQARNHVICPQCAAKIEAGRQAPRPIPWLRVALYGVSAAVAGSLLYAIPLAMGFEIGIVALAVGWMVGKAIRHGSFGTGGRPQQILAVGLTYFAIGASFLPATIFITARHAVQAHSGPVHLVQPGIAASKIVGSLLVLSAISPFLELRGSFASGLISLFILFIGMQRAWALTARHEILVTGPYT